MTLGTAKEEIDRSDELWGLSDFRELRKQQEKDFGLWGPHEFKMPQSEGAWDSVTTNSAKVLANKIMGLLSSSWLQLYIDVDEETRKKRKSIANTERLANGIIWLSDREATAVPSGRSLQDSLVAHAVLRGGTVKSVYWYTGSEDKPQCELKAYDPMYCQWLEGERELLWFCYRDKVRKHFIEHAFKKQIKDGADIGSPDSNGYIQMYTFWDDEEWRIAINGEYIDQGEHGLGYIPVNVRSCGSAPYLKSEKYQDTMRESWMSYAANTRNIYDLESKLLSIESSKAVDSGRKDIVAEFDSTLGKASDVTKVGYGAGQRNNILQLDKAHGQEFKGFVEAPGNQVVDQFLSRVRQDMDILATIDPIAYGQMSGSGSGVLAAELRAAALEFINPFRKCIESDLIWTAEEIVSQYKGGQYDKVEVEGKDNTRKKFFITIGTKDVEEKKFDCELVPDKLRDEIQELGAAIQKVSFGLSSRKTVMVKHNIVADPDLEIDKIEEEIASQDPVLRYDKLAKYFKDQGNDRMAQYYVALSALTIEGTVKKAMMAELMPQEEGAKPPTVSPQAQVGNMASTLRSPGSVM